MGLHQTKKFFTVKKISNKLKRQPMEGENIFTNTSDKGLIPKIHKELTKLNTKNNKQPNFKMGRGPDYALLQRGHTDGQ